MDLFEALAAIAFRLCATEAELSEAGRLNAADIANQDPETIARLRDVFAECRSEIRRGSDGR